MRGAKTFLIAKGTIVSKCVFLLKKTLDKPLLQRYTRLNR